LRDNNWYMWVIILGFGWSVAGGVAGVLVTQLGFPYTWVMPLTAAMVGAVAFLAYRGYPVKAWVLAGCIGFIIVSAMAIARALTASNPNIPDAYRQEFETSAPVAASSLASLGVDFPLYGDYAADYFIEYEEERTAYLIGAGYGGSMPVTVEFPPLAAAGGQWAFRSGSMRLRGSINASADANPRDNWSSADEATFEPDQALRTVHPQMQLAILLPSKPTREPLSATATMTVVYPLPGGEVKEATLSRDFTLSVAGEDYYVYHRRYVEWQRTRSVVETPIWAMLIAGSVLAGAGGVYLVKEGALQPQPASGLSFVIRRLSGAQRLGADLYHVEKLRDLTDAEQGVYVGRVVAQSPAGRAGLRTGDVLIELGGKQTNNPAAVNRLAKGRKRGEILQATVLHDGQRVDLQVNF
jgi:hypothetical protein